MGLIGCAVCRDLLNEYGEATAKLLRTSKEFSTIAMSRETDMFMRALAHLSAIRDDCAEARKSFLYHFQSHMTELDR